jgi:hypothetical protein
MRRLVFAMTLLAPTLSSAAEPDKTLYEMRTYTAAPGKLAALNARFKEITIPLFEKHGMTNVGYFVPADNKENKLIYFLAHKDAAAKDASWKGFMGDDDMKKKFAETEKNGRLAVKVDRVFLTATDYSPAIKVEKGKDDRIFELRTYTASKGNLPALNARFKDHTLKLFEKHGMTNVAYWNYAPGLKQKGEEETLIYLLAHKSEAAMKASFEAFRADPTWVAAKKASEDKAGGSLTVEKDGVKSVVLKATDYSPMK